MPELPEVETVRRGIAPHIQGRAVAGVIVRQPLLRWPVPAAIDAILTGQVIRAVSRRGKYLVLETGIGALLVHLGMSGSLRLVDPGLPPAKHDHVDFLFTGAMTLRFNDPRRFGSVLWTAESVHEHALLRRLGPEPLLDGFDGRLLHGLARNRATPVKSFIMDSKVVVGVGNIYANEALFLAGIRPARAAGAIALKTYERLAGSIRTVLQDAIGQGGTTLRDYVNERGKPGYFQQQLRVYGRAGLPCRACGATLRGLRISNRATAFCPVCQR